MRLRRQPENVLLRGRVPVGRHPRRRKVVRPDRARQVLPEKLLKCPDLRRIDREFRIHGKPILPWKEAKPEAVVAIGVAARRGYSAARIVKIVSDAINRERVYPRVHRRRKPMRVVQRRLPVLRYRQVVVVKPLQRHPTRIVIKLIDQQNVRLHPLDYLRHPLRLRIVRRAQIRLQLTERPAIQRRIVRRNPHLERRPGRRRSDRHRHPNPPSHPKVPHHTPTASNSLACHFPGYGGASRPHLAWARTR